jgi:uncharacterized membrane protein
MSLEMVFTCFAINDSGCLKAATVPFAIPLCYWDLVLDSWSLHFFGQWECFQPMLVFDLHLLLCILKNVPI